jgi:predicted acylesterase/phospholipase RssA
MELLTRRFISSPAASSAPTNPDDDHGLPDFFTEFISDDDLHQFEKALNAPDALSLVAINDWGPIHQRVRKSRKSSTRRSKDETREGFVYTLMKWPLLAFVISWISVLSGLYLLTRLYIFLYEHFVAWTGRRNQLRSALRSTNNYDEWKKAAIALDKYLGNDKWKEEDDYAYYDHATINTVTSQLTQQRTKIERPNNREDNARTSALEELRTLLEACVKNNFVGVENPRLYSETYFGTKNLVQEFIDEVERCLQLVLHCPELSAVTKHNLFQHMDASFGRSALCLSGGATFSYYHFGVARALLDNKVLPDIISGTSGGALVAAMIATHTDAELEKLLVPELAYRIRACEDDIGTWVRRWWKTGARFDTLDWALKCSWFCRGSTTFREAYERTGRILNVSCVPSDPHSPTILANYKTSPNCVIWSAVIASAAVPGILNPVVLMMKRPDGTLAPYSFGHKWKDGSLRTDIPLKALDVHFNASFPIVSQVSSIRPTWRV